MIWQDMVFTAGGFALALLLLPTLLDTDAAVPRLTSVPTAAVLTAFSFAFFTLGLVASATMNAITAAAWTTIAIWRAT